MMKRVGVVGLYFINFCAVTFLARNAFAHLRVAFALVVILSMLPLSSAYAACSTPNGVAGSVDYDDATKTRKICDGTTWKTMTEVDYSTTGARQRLQVANDAGTCTAIKTGRLRYNGTTTWEYCNGSAWVSF